LEAHAAAAAEVLAHAEQMLAEWQQLAPVLREITLGSGAAGGNGSSFLAPIANLWHCMVAL
jgi:hypothetical protein